MGQYLQLNDLLSQEASAPVWAINNSSAVVEGGGDVNIQVVVNGATQRIVIPRTWIPINLTETVPRKYLLDAMNFASAIASRMILVVSQEHADALRRDADYMSEYERVTGYLRTQRTAIATDRTIKDNVIVSKASGADDNTPDTTIRSNARPLPRSSGNGGVRPTVLKASSEKALDISNFLGEDPEVETVEVPEVTDNFRAWVVALNGKEDEKAASNDIRRRNTLSGAEVNYLIDNIKYDVIRERLMTFRSEQMG